MMDSHAHWGEFEDNKRQDDWNLSLNDVEELMLNPSPPPSIYQPSQEETASFQILPPEICRSDPLVLHTIKLLQHQRQLLQLLTRTSTFGLDVNAAAPQFPEDPPIRRKAAKFHYLNFLPPNETPFTAGVARPQRLEIEASTARLILRKGVATLCAHAGYTDTTESVLKVLTNVAHEFFAKITGVLRSNKDNMLLNGNCPFHDVVEQTLHDMRMGGIAELHRTYTDRVVLYHARIRQKTLQLHHQYQNLLTHAGSSTLYQSLRRDSTNNLEKQPSEEANSTSASYTLGMTPTLAEDTSVLSIMSSSSVEHDGSTQAYSVHSQTGVEEEQSPAGSQSHLYSATR